VPVNKGVRVQVVADDVIHSFVVQSFGRSASTPCPGPAQRDLVQADRVGIFYGQCSKLCGKDHAFMPDRHPRRPDEAICGLARRCEEKVCERVAARRGRRHATTASIAH